MKKLMILALLSLVVMITALGSVLSFVSQDQPLTKPSPTTDKLAAQSSQQTRNEEVAQHDSIALLVKAATEGQTEIIKELLGKGLAVDARDEQGRTALMNAAANGQVNTIKLLLSKGADINAKHKWGGNAFIFAAFFSRLDIMSRVSNMMMRLQNILILLVHARGHHHI